MGFSTGTRLGSYEIQKVIGAGGGRFFFTLMGLEAEIH